MDQDDSLDRRLCSIDTLWSVVKRAHGHDSEAARSARHELLARYGGAIRRYLTAATRDPMIAEELSQDFSLRFLNGDFHNADPGRGRFRDYLKTSVYHMIVAHHARQKRQALPLPDDQAGPAVMPDEPTFERIFAESWRDELLANAWEALAGAESKGGPPHYTVLKFRADHPDLSSAEMADQLTRRGGRAQTPAGVRQALHRARDQFAARLIDEIANSLGENSLDRIEEELIDLGLFEYCREFLRKRNE